ncbi:MAG TPA: 2-hydroxychromene-2-carboxylate isomerase [Burkholderiaceae bacterium]|nr:2-hydroxychromene-2-carboxylate isomerase [Burkholderiaceae bacterium]
MTPLPIVEFYFDPISPYAWLAARQCARLDPVGRLEFRPVLFAGLLSAHGNKGPAELPAKRAYTMRDVIRCAGRLGVPMRGPPTHPFNPLRALRMCTALDDPLKRRRFALALFEAAWERGLDLTDDAVLAHVAADCGLDSAELLARAADPEIKRRLAEATEAAIAAGVFGVPTFCVDGELFWGADRIDAVLWRLQGHRTDEALLGEVLARPASAARKP